MLENKIPDVVVNKLIIPKINRNKKSAYGKKFNKELENIHFGELAYGTMYKLDINVIMGLELNISNTISKDKYEIKRNIEIIEINHRCYYYIKNKNIEVIDYKKLSLNKLKSVVLEKGLTSDPSKLKKQDLLKLLNAE